MAFIALEQGLRYLLERQVMTFDPVLLNWLYVPKAALVGLLLLLFRRHYTEIRCRDLLDIRKTLVSAGSGVLVFYLWVNMDWTLGSQSPPGFDPEVFSAGLARWSMIAVRVTGAVVIVPIMEELFWRSFLMRYLVDSHFIKVEVGRFTLFSFLAVALLFGLEHHYLFAGIMAGVVFNLVCCYSRSITHCIVSHAVANLCLAVYVMQTSLWRFW